MSLVATWVRAVDDRFYKDPIVSGPGWFICFDDDDPPELVIRKYRREDSYRERAIEILKQANISFGKLRVHSSGHRYFSKRRVAPATSYFVEILSPIPVPAQYQDSASWEEVYSLGQALIIHFDAGRARSAFEQVLKARAAK